MQKIVLKKADILESNRPVIIKTLETFEIEEKEEEEKGFLPLKFETQEENVNNLHSEPNPLEQEGHPENIEIKAESQINLQKNLEEIEKRTLEEIETLKENAQKEAQEIKSIALDEKNSLLDEAKKEIEILKENAQKEAQEIKNTAEKEIQDLKNQSQKEGFEKGYQEGLEQSQQESKRLISLLQKITSEIVGEKDKLLTSIEADLVDLTLLIANKVVKSVTESYKRVVYDNVTAAISKLKVKSDLIVKVNPEDLPTIEKYKEPLLKEIDGIENIKFLEDPSIDKGGCIITSDFGSVDARISSQFAEIEEQVRRLSPIKEI